MDATALIVASLAVYRISRMIAIETGPFSIFQWFRSHFRYNVLGDPLGWVSEGFNCPLCISFWLSLIPAIFIFENWLIYWFAIAGLSTLLYKLERE